MKKIFASLTIVLAAVTMTALPASADVTLTDPSASVSVEDEQAGQDFWFCRYIWCFPKAN